jgi:hypothetical protein
MTVGFGGTWLTASEPPLTLLHFALCSTSLISLETLPKPPERMASRSHGAQRKKSRIGDIDVNPSRTSSVVWSRTSQRIARRRV